MKKPVIIEVLSHRRAKVVDPSEALSEVLDRELSFQATEERFARMHNGAWDGRKRFYHAMSGSFALGLLRRVKNLITDLGLKVTVRDLREQKPPQPNMSLVHPDMLEGVSMSGIYALQFTGLVKVLKRGGGMVRAATNFGKLTIAAGIIKAYLASIRAAVVLVHKQKLMYDHRRDLAAFLGTIEQNIGVIGDTVWNPKKVTIVIVDSLLLRSDAKRNHKRIREFLKTQDLLILDEAHHGAAKKWARVLQRCHAPVRVGLSGSYVPGGASLGIEAQLGPVVLKVTNAQLTALGISAKLTVKLREVEEPEDLEGAWRDVYQQGIVDNVQRNAQIADDTLDAFSKKLPVVVMVREKRHGRNLSELLRARKVPHKFLYSTGFPGGLKAIEGFLAAFEKGILPVLLTTTGLFDEGANLPAIRRLIMGDGLKSLRLVLQKCGRALRRKKGEDNTVEVYDYMDVFNEWLAGHSLERLNIYEKEGFEVIEL